MHWPPKILSSYESLYKCKRRVQSCEFILKYMEIQSRGGYSNHAWGCGMTTVLITWRSLRCNYCMQVNNYSNITPPHNKFLHNRFHIWIMKLVILPTEGKKLLNQSWVCMKTSLIYNVSTPLEMHYLRCIPIFGKNLYRCKDMNSWITIITSKISWINIFWMKLIGE